MNGTVRRRSVFSQRRKTASPPLIERTEGAALASRHDDHWKVGVSAAAKPIPPNKQRAMNCREVMALPKQMTAQPIASVSDRCLMSNRGRHEMI